jgi:hypothetical protein
MEIINVNDKLYVVYRRAKEKFLTKPGIVDFLRELWHCDTVLKQNDVFIFCRNIDDVVIEQEITN